MQTLELGSPFVLSAMIDSELKALYPTRVHVHVGRSHTKRYIAECGKVGELASKLMRTQNARSVRVAVIKFIINTYYYRENYILFAKDI